MDTKSAVSGKAVARFIRTSPTKVARVLNQIRGCTYEEALLLLEFLPYRACEPVWQVVQSAASNAQNKYGVNKQDLIKFFENYSEKQRLDVTSVILKFMAMGPRKKHKNVLMKKKINLLTYMCGVFSSDNFRDKLVSE